MQDFDEKAYLMRYPDVAAAVRQGHLPSGLAHFERHGISEGRSGDPFAKSHLLPRWWNMEAADEHLLGRFPRKINVRTIADLNKLIVRSLTKIDPEISLVVGVPRSGLLVANVIALHLNVPLVTLDAFLSGDLQQTFTRRVGTKHANPASLTQKPKIIIVDDSVGTGQTLANIKAAVERSEAGARHRVSYLAAYACSDNAGSLDSHLEILEHPRVFEWNLLHHDYTNSFCVDMDGVLCEDPAVDENDEGERYLRFLSTARPKVLPSRGVGAIVTARLEKFRPQTTAWLAKYGIKYKRLIMLNLATGDERRRLGAHAKFKADVYQTLGGYLFVESDPNQSREIFDLTGMPVFCPDTAVLHH
jgi:uncharacterized HAD superfamily protein/hypoxanthine phosphoribosyltransferase